MRYNKLIIKTDKQFLEPLQAVLIENGLTSMMIDDPDDVTDILEHPDTYRYDYINEEITRDMDRRPSVTLFFEDDEEGTAGMKRAEEILSSLSAEIEITREAAGDDSDWLYKWQEYFKPTKVGSRIVVRPGWEEYEAAEDELVIEMDPGMAFGSGLHETTSMCIKALETVLSSDSVRTGEAKKGANRIRVLDVGCGTGILAIAAALLGADECLGIDIDPDAVRVSKENIEKNGLTDKIRAQYGDLTEGVDYQADIVAANLMADLVIKLSPAAAGHVVKGGWYITSGILDIKEEIVSKAVEAAGFKIEEVLHDGEWCAIVARR